MSTESRSESPIVVAVDGSAASVAALRWAAAQVTDQSRLRVVTAYSSPTPNVEFLALQSVDWGLIEQAAQAKAQAAMVEALGHTNVEHVVSSGSIEWLLAQQRDASMIVLGTRLRRSWFSRLRPSATNRVTGLVDCTVVSIPSDGAATHPELSATPSLV